MSFLGPRYPSVRDGTPEGTEKGPKVVNVGLRGRERELEDLVGFKEKGVLGYMSGSLA